VAFVRGAGEELPFADGAFDAVICRIALPYMDNARALSEMDRVLGPSGQLFLKIHHAVFYLDEARRAVRAADVRSLVHAARVLAAGAWYHASGRQPGGRLLGSETFQSRWLLRRELLRLGLTIRGEMPDSARDAPSYVIGR
jgi:SAM-dependent methyltransferase